MRWRAILRVPVVVEWAGYDHAALLAAVNVPAAPVGLMRLVSGARQFGVGDLSVNIDLLFPVLDTDHLFRGLADRLHFIALEGFDICGLAGQQNDGRDRGGAGRDLEDGSRR